LYKARILSLYGLGLVCPRLLPAAIISLTKMSLKTDEKNWEWPASLLLECVVCSTEKEQADFPSMSTTSACSHKPKTCQPCLQASISHDINHKGVGAVSCPDCGVGLNYHDVVRCANKLTRKRYESMMIRAALQDDEAFVWVSQLI
jgi:hypothetical protein